MLTNLQLFIYHGSSHLPEGMSREEYLMWYSLPFIFAILYFVYKFFRNRNRVSRWYNGRISSDFETTENNLAEVFIVLGASISKRGKFYIRAKEGLVNAYINKHFPAATSMVDESFDFSIWNPIDLNELVFWCSEKLNREQKLQLFEFLAWLALVDHELIDEEKELLLYVLNRFNLSLDELTVEARSTVEFKKERVAPVHENTRKRYLNALGIVENASEKEIKRMYRLLVKEVHPDRHPNASPEEKRLLEARFQEIQEAYDFLTKS